MSNLLDKSKLRKALPFLLTLAAGLGLGYLFFSGSGDEESHAGDAHQQAQEDATYTCSMHPQIRREEPGDCPICGMDLVPVSRLEDESETPAGMVSLRPEAQRLARIATAPVEAQIPVKSIRLTGTLEPDQSSMYTQSAHFAGRVERLYVDAEGEMVRAGQTVAEIYAPELIPAQQELLQAAAVREQQPALYQAAREKLQRMKVPAATLDRIEARGEVRTTMPIVADQSGHIIRLRLKEGGYVEAGAPVLALHNHRRLWLHLDAYEDELAFIQKGDPVTFTVAALPAERFTGRIHLVTPHVREGERSAQVRVVVENSGKQLKPGMLAVGQVKARMADSARLTVPSSAVLWTGARSVVFVAVENGASPGYQMRTVRLGPRLDEAYVVDSGLKAGEQVVRRGAFALDAAAQLNDQTSMMRPASLSQSQEQAMFRSSKRGGVAGPVGASPEGRKAVRILLEDYLALKRALTRDDTSEALKLGREMAQRIRSMRENAFSQKSARQRWKSHRDTLGRLLPHLQEARDLSELRRPFLYISGQMVQLVEAFQPQTEPLYLQFCPMADEDKGAFWLSREEAIRNPYYGAQMLSCGNVEETLPPATIKGNS